MEPLVYISAERLGDSSEIDIARTRLVLDSLGEKSAIAQNLNVSITSWEKFFNSNHGIVLCTAEGSGEEFIGFIKFGRKDLYFYDKTGKVHAKCCDCVLDFYVDDRFQRQGLGLVLFNKMIEILGLDPCTLAYDRPSPKLIGFMRKHFNLLKPDLQPNRFAIFEGFSFK